jgi:hypothetical protein
LATYYYSDNSQNPPYSPFAKGGNCYPPLWKRGARGDFLIKPLNISVLHRAINAIYRISITTGIIFDELYGIRQGMSRQRLPFAMLSPTSERKKGKSNRE